MNELTAEWVEKAEGDYATAGRELAVRHRPNYDAVCFHAQHAKVAFEAAKTIRSFIVTRLGIEEEE